ncbi:hypothetical protein BDW75DRAFT_246123 [Aspergillus navahoensis]
MRPPSSSSSFSSLVLGPDTPPLGQRTLGSVIDEQGFKHGHRTAVVVPWQSVRLTYAELAARIRLLDKAALEIGLKHGGPVGIMAGNRYEYLEVFLACARIGCPVVMLNNTCTPKELESAVTRSSCKLMFLAPTIGRNDLATHVETLRGKRSPNPALANLRRVVLLDPAPTAERGEWNDRPPNSRDIDTREPPQQCPLRRAMRLTPTDVVCCPPALFHCSRLIMDFPASFVHGSSIIFPSDAFDPLLVVDAAIQESATIILGVPPMHIAE